MARIAAVTGGTGFIGGRLVAQMIADGWQVRVLVRGDWPTPHPSELTIVRGSLDDREALDQLTEGCDVVVHSAGAVRAASDQEFYEANAAGAGRLAAAAAATGSQPLFVHLSSLAARAPEVSPYAASKRAGEEQIALNVGDLKWFALRPPAVYGPGDRATLSIFKPINRGIGPILGSTRARVSLIFVDDLVAAILAAVADPPPRGSIFEVSDGAEQGYSWREIGAAAAQVLGKNIFYLRVPKPILQIAAAVNVGAGWLTGNAPMMTLGKVRELCYPDWVCRDNPLIETTAWRPRVGIDDGFSRTLKWYRKAGWI